MRIVITGKGLSRAHQRQLDRIEAKLDALSKKENTDMGQLEDKIAQLQTQVAATTSAEQSAITLIQGLAANLSAAVGDSAAVQAVIDQMNASAAALAAAVVANTPAAPPSPPAPPTT